MHYARVVAAFEFKEPRRLPLNRREGRGRAERVVVVDEDEVGPGRIRAPRRNQHSASTQTRPPSRGRCTSGTAAAPERRLPARLLDKRPGISHGSRCAAETWPPRPPRRERLRRRSTPGAPRSKPGQSSSSRSTRSGCRLRTRGGRAAKTRAPRRGARAASARQCASSCACAPASSA